MQPVFKGSTLNSVLALSLIKRNPHLARDARAPVQNAAPARRHWGSNGTRAGSDIRYGQRWTKPPLADPFQPRLVAGVRCLIVTFDN